MRGEECENNCEGEMFRSFKNVYKIAWLRRRTCDAELVGHNYSNKLPLN
jgi:hypothetical protein